MGGHNFGPEGMVCGYLVVLEDSPDLLFQTFHIRYYYRHAGVFMKFLSLCRAMLDGCVGPWIK